MTQESKRHDPDTAELPARNQCGTQYPEEDSPPRKRKSSRKHLNNLNAVETERTTFAKVAGRVQELNDAKTRLEAQAMEAKSSWTSRNS